MVDTFDNTENNTNEDNSKLLKALQSERQKNAETVKKLKQYQNIDLDRYNALLEAEKQREEKELESTLRRSILRQIFTILLHSSGVFGIKQR